MLAAGPSKDGPQGGWFMFRSPADATVQPVVGQQADSFVARPGRLRCAVIATGAILTIFIAGCSSSSGSNDSTAASPSAVTSAPSSSVVAPPTASPTSSAELCAARDQLKASLSALVSPALLTGGVAGIKSAVAAVQNSLQAVATAAKSDYAPEVGAVGSSLARLQAAVGGLGSGGATITGLAAIGSDIGAVGTSTTALLAQLKSRCGS